jgi:hypothetical protein
MEAQPFVRGGRARGHIQFVIDRAQVCMDGATADDQSIGDLLIAQPLGYEPENLDLAFSQAGSARLKFFHAAACDYRPPSLLNQPIAVNFCHLQPA